jgi:hypothetical protein
MPPPAEPRLRQRRYSVRHQARLDAETHATLEPLANTFGRPAAEVSRQLIWQAKLGDFPPSWQMTAHKRRAREAPADDASLAGRNTVAGPLEGARGRTGGCAPR